MVDVHCHLNFKAFKDDYDEVIKQAFAAGVTKIINVGTKIDSSRRAVELADKYENLYAIVGVHPHHADKPLFCHPEFISGSQEMPKYAKHASQATKVRHDNNDWLTQLEQLAKHPKVVGIGECGMDYYRYQSNDIVSPKLQREVFVKQIELAHRLKKPLQIHNRHAGKEILDILINHKSYLLSPAGMFHCMSGNIDFLKKALDLGFYIGFDGNITYQGLAPGEDTLLADLVKATPIDRIVVETDSPYLAPAPHRGSKNTPENAIIVGKEIAKIKGLSFEEVEQQTVKNTHELFFKKRIT